MATAAKKPAVKAKGAVKTAPKTNTSAPKGSGNGADVSESGAASSAPVTGTSDQQTGQAQSVTAETSPAGGDNGAASSGETISSASAPGASSGPKSDEPPSGKAKGLGAEKYRAKTPIQHDGKDYAPDDDFPAGDHVEQLLAVKAIERVTDA